MGLQEELTPQEQQEQQYILLRMQERLTPAETRRKLHIHYREAAHCERVLQRLMKRQLERHGKIPNLPNDLVGDEEAEPFPKEVLSNEALEALYDFAVFRRRYFGRTITPWQSEAADILLDHLETPNKEYIVVNCPPGSGKSTLFAHDIPVWLAVRNRALRCLIGSYTERQAVQYIGRIRRTLMRRTPMEGADSTLLRDFGGFRPLQRDLWRVNEFIIAQVGETDYEEKEPSFAAFGYDSAFLGGRFDLIVWDDLVDKHVLRSSGAIEAMERWWGDEAETRCEPGGLVVLQGQRMAASDLYRHALELKQEDGTPKYHHIVFKAHYDEDCMGWHTTEAPAWPTGCLLDPIRVPWRELASKKRNAFGRYQTLYQQEDTDESESLLRPIYLEGGEEDDILYPGCWDKQRRFGEPPSGHDAMVAVLTVDPSPTSNWGILFWLVDPATEFRHLVNVHNGPLNISDFLDYDYQNNNFGGLVERWYRRYADLGIFLRYLVIEVNAAQRWAIQSRHMQQWAAVRGVTLVSHTTTLKKSDEDYGVQALRPLFAQGKVRIPAKGESEGRDDFITQHYQWPHAKKDDLVMSHWFLENCWNTVSVRVGGGPRLWTPSWLHNADRGLTRDLV